MTQASHNMHSGFLSHFLFRFVTSSVRYMSRKSDILHGPIDDLALKIIHLYVFQAAPKRKYDIL